MERIQLIGIHKSFDGVRVLHSVSHTFEPGSITALSGRSGSGKTTLLHVIMGLMPTDAGRILGVEGLRIGAVFQDDRLIEHVSARANVRLVCPRAVPGAEIDRHLDEVGLGEEGNKPASECSGGMRRRVALVRALITRPELLILDEPFKGLDADTRRRAAEYIRRHRADATTIIATHEPEEARLIGASSSFSLDIESEVQ